MSVVKRKVRELAGWGMDNDEYRPDIYRGDPEHAHALVTGRPSFKARSAVVEFMDGEMQGLLEKQKLRTDLAAEMAGLDWFLGVIDLRLLLSFQRRITFDQQTSISPVPAADDWAGLTDLCFGETKPVTCNAIHSDRSVVFRSTNPNLQFRITDDLYNPVVVHAGSPFFEVASYRDRWFLRDGYHRAFRCLQSGVVHLPAVIVRARTIEELGAVHPWFFPEEVLFSSVPPCVADFLDDVLVIEYDRSPLIKTLSITVEETYTLQGEEQ